MTRPLRLPTASDPALQAANRLRGLLAILEDCGASEVPVGGPLFGDSDRPSGEIRESEGNQPPTFAEMMAVIGKRARRRGDA